MKLNDVLTIHDTLNRKFWADDKLKDEILYNLRSIAQDFFKELNLEGVEIDDITFTGSLANFNYTSYSDIDLHILVDFNKIDENEELVREYFSGKSSNWNNKHNINILVTKLRFMCKILKSLTTQLAFTQSKERLGFECPSEKTLKLIYRW
jgi:predicted nucleotidyltransferase